jgi:hypothetical protein
MVSKADERWDAVGDNPIVILSELRSMMSEAKENPEWVDELSQFIEDEDVDKVIQLVLKIIDGDMPDANKIAVVCARLQAYNVKFRTQFSAYMSYKKGTTEANMKKNHYKELYTGIDRLVDSLKYLMR